MAPKGDNKKVDHRTRRWDHSLVEDVINDYCDGSPTELARKMSKVVGKDVSRSVVHGWRLRGQFPPEFVPYVHRMTRLPLADLIERNRPRFKIPTQR
jgi:hypothetical protein